jgi:hypothetical protein
MRRELLAAGETVSWSLKVKAGRAGNYELSSPSFSYDDHQGNAHNVRNFAAEITVEPEAAPLPAAAPEITVELVSKRLARGEWDVLRGIVANSGQVDAFDLAVELTGNAVTAEGSGTLVARVLAPGASAPLTFHVLAREAGAHVPIPLAVSYRGEDGSPYSEKKTLSVAVGNDRVSPGGKRTKILFLGASPPDLPSLRIDEEIREIEQEIRLGRDRDRIEVATRLAVRPPDISRALLDVEPDLVHFAGHGGGDDETFIAEDVRGESVLVPVAGLVDLFKAISEDARCILVNACNTQRLATELSAALPDAYVVGMRAAVADRSAIKFSVGFYQAVAAGRNIEEAFKLGKAHMLMAYDRRTIPVLWRGGQEIRV